MKILVKTKAGLAFTRPINVTYTAAVRSARAYLRKRDFLHYGSQLIPEKTGSETWSLAWAYIREVDDVIDTVPSATADQVLEEEWAKVEEALEGGLEPPYRMLRDPWLAYLFANLRRYYTDREIEKALQAIRELYWSAVMDAARRGRALTAEEMARLLRYKAASFFKLYFTLSRFNMQGYEDKIAELLGLALGMLDDFLDALYDIKTGYINLTREELEAVRASGYAEALLKVAPRRGRAILKLLMRARQLAMQVRGPLARKTVLRLTEAFAAPILEGRFVPGATYFFKGGKLLLKILPEDEIKAYEVGHRLVKTLLSLPQLAPALIKVWIKITDASRP